MTGSSEPDSAPMPEVSSAPLLSIGLAVYNGAEYLRGSIDSLLTQDVESLELIISDNASNDDTESICREYAGRDDRVRYARNETNIGAAGNFNRVFELSRGRYFMWGSDDDLWDPQFARLCIEKLERSPRAVMCTSQVILIDSAGEVVTDVTYEAVDTEGMSVDRRVFEMTRQAAWFDTYSVIRPSALRATQMLLPTYGMDVRLQLELLLQGDSLVVPQKLRAYRLPSVGKTAAEYVAEIDSTNADAERDEELRTPFTYMAKELVKVVRDSELDRDIVGRIENDLVETLTLVNTRWGGFILEESGFDADRMPSSSARRAVFRAALGVGTAMEVLEPPTSPWRPLEGMRLSAIRKTLLRLLRPFTDRQDELDTQFADSIELLSWEADWLHRRVRDLERPTTRQDGPGQQ
ncbi:MAG: glycosyltransferase [Coriobacteriia bacterium]